MKEFQAGVIVKTRFVDKSAPSSGKSMKAFSSYIDYIDRNEAIRNQNFTKYNLSSQYKNYQDYMGNPEKTGGLFTDKIDVLNADQRKDLKEAFQKGYDNDSIMWQTVVSFDNRFLTKLGIYDPISGVLNEKCLQEATRIMMKETLKHENMSNSAVWSAAIHYNTDNIHIHIAYTEPVSTRQRKLVNGENRPKGYFSKKTFRSMKQKMVNKLLESEFTVMNQLMREKLIGGKKTDWTLDDQKLKNLWLEIYKKLPSDKRKWNYKNVVILQPLIDKLSREYIMTYHKEDYAQFQKLVMKQQSAYEIAYGKNSSYKDYAENKMKDLYKRMGNVILTEMREYNKIDILAQKINHEVDHEKLNVSMRRLKNLLHQAFKENINNEYEHEKLEFEIQNS